MSGLDGAERQPQLASNILAPYQCSLVSSNILGCHSSTRKNLSNEGRRQSVTDKGKKKKLLPVYWNTCLLPSQHFLCQHIWRRPHLAPSPSVLLLSASGSNNPTILPHFYLHLGNKISLTLHAQKCCFLNLKARMGLLVHFGLFLCVWEFIVHHSDKEVEAVGSENICFWTKYSANPVIVSMVS